MKQEKREDYAIHSCELTWEILSENPVWTECEDSNFIRPLKCERPFDQIQGSLTIRARFRTPLGTSMVGDVVYGETFERVYLVEIFVKGTGIAFNRNLASLVGQQIARLRLLTGNSLDPIFPLEFETDLADGTGRGFCGVFDPR